MDDQEKSGTGVLYLIPTPLGEAPLDLLLPAEVQRIVAKLRYFVVERAKTRPP